MHPDYFDCGVHFVIIPRGIHKYFWDNLMNLLTTKCFFMYIHKHIGPINRLFMFILTRTLKRLFIVFYLMPHLQAHA